MPAPRLHLQLVPTYPTKRMFDSQGPGTRLRCKADQSCFAPKGHLFDADVDPAPKVSTRWLCVTSAYDEGSLDRSHRCPFRAGMLVGTVAPLVAAARVQDPIPGGAR